MASNNEGPGIVTTSLKAGALLGIVGTFIGGTFGIVRSRTPVIFAVVSGLQWFTLASTYTAARRSYTESQYAESMGTDDLRYASTFAGGVAGATSALIFRGRANILPATMVLSGMGYCGQVAYEKLDRQHTKSLTDKEDKSNNILQRIAKSKWVPVQALTDEEYRDILQEKLLRVDTEIALIDDRIEEIRSSQISPTNSINTDT